jgi:dihydropteroate synthase
MNFARNREIKIMGIVNITDDSFYCGSRFLSEGGIVDLRAIKSQVAAMVEDGADIIDLGACSSRPYSEPVDAKVEWERLHPVLKMMVREFPETTVSVDTFRAEVAERAADVLCSGSLARVPMIVNDISAGEDDEAMLPLVGSLGLPYIAMHKRGSQTVMQDNCDYPDGVAAEVLRYFEDFSLKAKEYGIENWILDPGFGFAKTLDQNYELLREMDKLQSLSREILVGVSRKSMIYRLLGLAPEESLAPTQVVHLAALQKGASILRVHDVAEAAQTVKIYKKL